MDDLIVKQIRGHIEVMAKEHAALSRRYKALLDQRRCEIATAICAVFASVQNDGEGIGFTISVALEHADALIAALEKKRDG